MRIKLTGRGKHKYHYMGRLSDAGVCLSASMRFRKDHKKSNRQTCGCGCATANHYKNKPRAPRELKAFEYEEKANG